MDVTYYQETGLRRVEFATGLNHNGQLVKIIVERDLEGYVSIGLTSTDFRESFPIAEFSKALGFDPPTQPS